MGSSSGQSAGANQLSTTLPTEMGLSSRTLPRYRKVKLGNNAIGEIGCKYIAAGAWESLRVLNLSQVILLFIKNGLKDKACKYISRGIWKRLVILNLSTET